MKTLTLFLLSILFFSNAYGAAAGENKVYIEQAGNTNTITIDQIGGGNMVGGTTSTTIAVNGAGVTTITPASPSSSNYALITGNTNSLTLNHLGDTNWAQYVITGSNNIYSNKITGNSNISILTIGKVLPTPMANLRNNINEEIIGNTNYTIQSISNDDIISNLKITGDQNQVTTDLGSSFGKVNTVITGGNNILFNTQAGVATGHDLTQDILGSFNSISTQQLGVNDSIIDIKVNGDHNTITVHSSDSTIASPLIATPR
jgi:hypothetical protein